MIIEDDDACCIDVADQIDGDGELHIEIEYESAWMQREQVEQLRDHLTKVLENE